jgi:hypothetical protein
VTTCRAVSAQPRDPHDYASLGTLNLAGGAFTIDTDALTISDSSGGGGVLYTGVADTQGGAASPGVVPEIAVFTFDDIMLDVTANVTITGTRAVALLSHGNATIGTPLSVDGGSVVSETVPGPGYGAGGPGGFAGGGSGGVVEDGEGPGGGKWPLAGGPVGYFGGAGSFGGSGAPGGDNGMFSYWGGEPGATYGDLSALLQGGSGGATNRSGGIEHGAGGGGAIEIAAANVLQIDAVISADGGDSSNLPSAVQSGGSGSGGAVRLSAAQVLLNADVRAVGGDNGSRFFGGGGRVYIRGGSGASFLYTLGQGPATIAPDDLAHIDVSPGQSGAFTSDPPPDPTSENFGHVTLSPSLTIVPAGQMLIFGESIDASTADRRLAVAPFNARILDGGVGDAGAGHANAADLELAGTTAAIVGTGVLTNRGSISGTGNVQIAVDNASGGTINAVGDTLTFTEAVDNADGAQINAINSTLDFHTGLTNAGELNLINTVVIGAVTANGDLSVAGDTTFTGDITGAGAFTGAGSVTFVGSYAPGDGSHVPFEGDVTFASSNTLHIDIGDGALDQLAIAGDATVGGALSITLLDGFMPALDDTFEILTAAGGIGGTFAETNLPALGGNLGWNLDYGANSVTLAAVPGLPGDFNLDGAVDAADYVIWRKNIRAPEPYEEWRGNFGASVAAAGSPAAASRGGAPLDTAVPAPNTLTLLILGGLAVCGRRRSTGSRGSGSFAASQFPPLPAGNRPRQLNFLVGGAGDVITSRNQAGAATIARVLFGIFLLIAIVLFIPVVLGIGAVA